MKILAIDTSGVVAGVCIAEDNKILAEVNINYKQNHSILLMPIIDNLLNILDIDLKQIDFLALSVGPGSFTGLRIGASAVKAIALSLNKYIIPISSLKVLAYNMHMCGKHIVPIIDAKSNRVFTAIFKEQNNDLINIYKESLVDLNILLDYINNNNLNPVFLGDGAINYKKEILKYNKDYCFARTGLDMQRSSALASIAFNLAMQNKYTTYDKLDLNYLRKSQAELAIKEVNK